MMDWLANLSIRWILVVVGLLLSARVLALRLKLGSGQWRRFVAESAETLAVACPFCTVMLDDGVRETGAKMQVIDLATLLAEAVEKRRKLAT